jgi:hypothetical protein
MNMPLLRPALAVIACAAAFSFVSPSFAEVVNLKAHMDAKDEVPPNQSKGKGDVTATYDTATKKLNYKGTYSDLSGPATAAHFHGPGAPGKNAGVVIPIFAGASAKSPFEGTATLTDAQAQQLLSGEWYVNVHTAANKGGEIRGQVSK